MTTRNDQEIEPEMREMLNALKQNVPLRDPSAIVAGRAKYLQELEDLPVSNSRRERLTFQNRTAKWFGFGKVKSQMTPTLVSIIVAIALFLGGGGASVAAAQSSLPDDLLYPVKLMSEDVRVLLAPLSQDKLDLELDLSQTRLDEIAAVLEAGGTLDEAFFTRLQTHLNTAYQLAVDSEDQNLEEMLQLQIRLREQIRVMESETPGQNSPADAVMLRARQMLENQVRNVDEDLTAAGVTPVKEQNRQAEQQRDTDQDVIQNQNMNQSSEQKQSGDAVKNQNQDMQQNQNQNQDMLQNQNQERDQIQNQNLNPDLETEESKDHLFGLTPTPFPHSGNGNGPNNGGGGRR